MSTSGNQLVNETKLLKDIMDIASKVVSRYISRAAIPEREKEDVIMAIVEKFLLKKEKILEAFEGKAALSTYYTAVINRMCCEIIRKENKHWYSLPEDENPLTFNQINTSHIDTEKKIVIKNEVKRFQNAMLFFNEERAKVYLFMKFLFDIPVQDEDIEQYTKGLRFDLKSLFITQQGLSKGETFEYLARLVNTVENKDIKADAVRMWLNKQIDILLQRLNGTETSFHTRESLAILIEIENNDNYPNVQKQG